MPPKLNIRATAKVDGELLLGLPYLRNEWNAPRLSVKVNYCLDCGISETQIWLCHSRSRVNYYLIYSTSETARVRQAHPNPVNYYLDYRTSETRASDESSRVGVNYYLDYRTSETSLRSLID